MAPKAKADSTANGAKPAKKAAAAAPEVLATTDGSAGAQADVSQAGPVGKPDKAAYDAEQEKLKKEIDELQTKLTAVKDKISLTTKSGSGNDRKTQLRAELDEIRGQQSNGKQSRTKIFEQLKAVQESVGKKVKDLNSVRQKVPFKTVAEVDAHVRNLEKQVESGSMKLADEKRALQEMSQMKRTRKTVEAFQADEDAIAADRATIEELKKQLDDPELKAQSDRYDTIRAELDELRKESDEAFASRNKLFDERNALQADLDVLFSRKRTSAQEFREQNDRYWEKVHEDRARRAERARAQREQEELEKKREQAERLREEAAQPAFQIQIEDCQTLIDFFSGKTTGTPALSTTAKASAQSTHDVRVVEAPQDVVPLKKKGESEDAYFVGGGGKGKKGKKAGGAKAAAASPAEGTLNIPFATLSALLTLSIPPPVGPADVPRVVEDLKVKKTWFEANQSRVTAEAVSKAEAAIHRLNITPPNGGGEVPAEPAQTPAVDDGLKSVTVPSEDVKEKLEEVKESEEEPAAAEQAAEDA